MKANPKTKIPPHNLPAPLSTFIGREHELAEVKQLLSANRLVTLTGAGGSGKTRLSLKAAEESLHEFEHGVWVVELASLTDPVLLPQVVASALNIQEQSVRSLLGFLVDYLSPRQTLLVLDNCEHLITDCAQFVDTILQKCPHLKILTTSREVLGITGEAALAVPPLSLPGQQPWTNPASQRDAVRYYEDFESVQLFMARAQTVDQTFRLTAENGVWVAEICRHLDGMPLAIELAAARVRSLSVQQIAQRLDDRFRLLTSGSRTAPARQQTLLATLDWSYTLLSSIEQKILRRLSIFAGGSTLEAAEAVCVDDEIQSVEVLEVLSRLVDKSLVMVDRPGNGETRYRLLETIRQYAHQKLSESVEVDISKDRHLHYFIRWAEKAEPYLTGPKQLQWLELYEAEHDNLRAALQWCNSDDIRAPAGLRLAAACGRFWRLRGYLSEGRMRLSAALSKTGAQAQTITRAWAMTLLANHMYLQSDYPAMRPVAEEALFIWRELGKQGLAGAAYTLDLLGELATEEGDYARAIALFQEALDIYKELNDERGMGQINMQFGWAAMRTGNLEQAEVYLQEFRNLAQKMADETSLAFAFSGLGEVAIRQGKYEGAVSLLEQALELNRERGDKWGTATSLGSLGWVAQRQHDFGRMKAFLDQSLSIRMEISDKGGIAWCLEKLAEAKYEQAQYQDAAKIFGHAESVRTPVGSVIDPADRLEYTRIISELRTALGEDTFTALWAYGSRMILQEVIDCAMSEPTRNRTSKEEFGGLTTREREVAALIAQGKSNREIAKAMTVGAKTIETYVTRILNKLGFDSRVQIATWAIEKGINRRGAE